MAGNKIEAGIKFVADTAEALRNLRALKAEMAGLKNGTTGTTGTSGGSAGQKSPTAQTAEAVAAANAEAAAKKKAIADVRAAERAAATAAEAEAKRLAALQRKAATDAAATAKLTRQEQAKAARLAPQITDIVTGLAGGQNPLLVAIQQGGQLRDVFGGVGNAAKALMSVFTPLRVAVGGVALVLGTLVKAWSDNSSQADAFNKALATTGQIAGTSAGQLTQMAQQIGVAQKVSTSTASDILLGLASTGQFVGSTLKTAGTAAASWAKLTGSSAEEAVSFFSDFGSSATQASEKANRQYHYLTAAQYELIRSLEAGGKTQEAQRVALEAFGQAMQERIVPPTNAFARAWEGVALQASRAWDAIKKMFDDSLESRIDKATAKVQELQRILGNPKLSAFDRQNYQRVLDQTQAGLDAEKEAAREKQALLTRQADLQKAQDDKIKIASKGYQDALASVDAAGAAKLLAQQKAALDLRAAKVKNAHDLGLTSELDYNLALNSIEQERLNAQAANIARQIEIEQGRVKEKPEDGPASQARVKQLEAQAAEVSGKLAKALADRTGIVAKDAVVQAQASSQAWAAAWQKAADEIAQLKAQNEADAAGLGASGFERARQEASAQVAGLVREVNAVRSQLELRLKLTTDPGQRAELEKQLAELTTQADQAIGRTTGKALFASLQQQAGELGDALALAEAKITAEVDRGVLTTVEGEAAKFAARDAALPQLQKRLRLMRELAVTPADANAVEQAGQNLTGLADRTTELQKTLRGGVASSFADAFTAFATGSQTALEAFKGFVAGVAKAALDLIAQQLGQQLVKSLLGSGGGASGGGGSGGFFSWIASLFHTGGVVGGGVGGMARAVSPALFGLAERYHGGGIAGLAADEVPAVLKKGEEVLTASDPRHRNNGGLAAGGVTVNQTIVVNADNGGTSAADAKAVADGMKMAVQQYVLEQMRPGGILAR